VKVTAFLGIGSNVDAERHVRAAVGALRERFDAVRLSPVYRASAVGFDGADFINLVAAVDTVLAPIPLKHWLNELEDRHGRRRDVPKYSDRTLDVDILLWGDLVLHGPELVLPRREIFRFDHVLRPLAELAPDTPCPGRGETFAELWAAHESDGSRLAALDPAFLDTP
jgi:2-amino-4-hydroxy-6-hydroxymethyldihydropteridine diphosphokinase